MLTRSPRRLALLSLICFIVLLSFVKQLPLAADIHYGYSRFSNKIHPNSAQTSSSKEYMQQVLEWNRPSNEPTDGHWPPYGQYVDKKYDPNRWEGFPMDHGFFDQGVSKLGKSALKSQSPYTPYPKYNSPEWKKQWKGKQVACVGPRGLPLDVSKKDLTRAYKGLPKDLPRPLIGSYEAVGLDGEACFDRSSRYGPYGYGDEEGKGVDWNNTNWGSLQNECLKLNQDRYRPEARSSPNMRPNLELPAAHMNKTSSDGEIPLPSYHKRTAVLIRSWEGYQYEENDITAIRAMVSELSLQSGGEYQVFLYVHIKDKKKPIFTDSEVYEEVLKANVPHELRDMALLWSEAAFPKWYPLVTDWQVYWHQYMCVQFFSQKHPEFDYVWNWETDARYIGQHYHFFEKIAQFAEKQPRKLMWERNKRYYIPEVHGSYSAFLNDTHETILKASSDGLIPQPVWGPRPYPGAEPPQKPLGPVPPTSMADDNFAWGVDEPADLITLLPIWDPRNTTWSYRNHIWNYVPTIHPVFNSANPAAFGFDHADFAHLERRAYINTVVRFSKPLLQAMHAENLAGRSMQAEMWPTTVALQHGLKAIYAPHPIFADRAWPARYADGIFNAHATVDAATGEALDAVPGMWGELEDSPYQHDREHNFYGWSWYYASTFPRVLYRRWLGWPVKVHEWGKEEEVLGGPEAEKEGGRMCLPGMLLHPVKKMGRERLIV
ncbi:uncharacterized protein BDZ99DRAFT_512874 [Mytilinidion resinicola]|uniref:Uncharacterized protein n=1 Tax=Mytilinidion resinicola TaxID=574789 RepID=A0A6A6Y0Q2_9PEZI|nr:uncharacterized protein BDZ99DRAFT_512874 [Mytilinidion resinicola]KAF2801594.1 hypothetical protein BDZ99DRAFT_512874 [Mytilinidion resinicola]